MASLPVKYPELGERFSRIMDGKGWTITQLAALAGQDGKGVTFATISRIRRGQTRPRAGLLSRLAQILEVSEAEIIGSERSMSRKRGQVTPESSTQRNPTPQLDTIEGKMAKIQAIKQQIEAAEALKPVLARLVNEVATELERFKSLTLPSP